jgi:hypothetical protein
LVLLVPGCIGGWTGDSDAGSIKADECVTRDLAIDAPSSLGVSGQDLVQDYGGTHTGVLTNADATFWGIVGSPPESDPVPIEITVSYANGRVVETQCGGSPADTLAVEVTLSVDVAQGMVTGQSTASLELADGTVETAALISAPVGTDAVLEIWVTFGTEGGTGTLFAATENASASAAFTLE